MLSLLRWGFGRRFLIPLSLLGLLVTACSNSQGAGDSTAGQEETAADEADNGATEMSGAGSDSQEGSGSAYPERPIEMIVAFEPGGGMDVTARLLTEPLGRILGTTVTVSNVTGGGGATGYSTAAQADPDGYTLTLASPAVVEHAHLREEEIPYSLESWEPSYLVSNDNHILIVAADSEFETAEQFFEEAESGDLLNALAGRLTSQDVGRALIQNAAGVEFRTLYTDVPYTAVLSGDADFALVYYPEVAGLLESGDLRALASTGDERSTFVPDVPTLKEIGIDAVTGAWRGVLAPAGTPPEIMDIINGAMAEVVEDPEWIAGMEEAGVPIDVRTPEEFMELMRQTDEDAQAIASIVSAE